MPRDNTVDKETENNVNMKGNLRTDTHLSVRLRTAFGRSKDNDNIGGVSPVTKLQAAKSEDSFNFRQRQNFFSVLSRIQCSYGEHADSYPAGKEAFSLNRLGNALLPNFRKNGAITPLPSMP